MVDNVLHDFRHDIQSVKMANNVLQKFSCSKKEMKTTKNIYLIESFVCRNENSSKQKKFTLPQPN